MNRFKTLFAIALVAASVSACATMPPLNRAIHDGDAATAATLINKDSANKEDAGGATPLIYAAQSGKPQLVKSLVGAGADVRYADKDWMFGFTPLHAAAEVGDVEAARILLEAGADPSAKTTFGLTPLAIAASQEHWDVVTLLQSKGASLTVAQNTQLVELQQCSYANGRADGYYWRHAITGFGAHSPETGQEYRAFFCKVHCASKHEKDAAFSLTRYNLSWWNEGDKRLPGPRANYAAYCGKGDQYQAYDDGWGIGVAAKEGEYSSNLAAVNGAIRAAGAVAMTSVNGGSAGQTAAQGMLSGTEAAGGFVDRKVANYTERKSHAKGCPEWAPWLLGESCYGTERQACHGKSGCGAVNE